MKTSAEIDVKTELLSFTKSGGCINCGTCTAVCPLPKEDVILPRRLLRLLHLGRMDDLVENAETIYSCLLCRLCEETCPAGVDISACVRFLRSTMNRRLHHLERE